MCAVGTVDVWIRNTSLHCQLANSTAAPPAPAPASDSSSSGGTPGWVWAIVGVVAAVAVAAAAGFLLWRRRRARQPMQHEAAACKVADPEEGVYEQNSHSTKLGSDGVQSGSLQSAGNSGLMEFSAGHSNMPEGPWKSRWVDASRCICVRSAAPIHHSFARLVHPLLTC